MGIAEDETVELAFEEKDRCFMNKRALIITTVSGFVPQFEMNNVKILQELGYEVHYASNYHMPAYGKDNSRLKDTGIVKHQVDFVRSPFRIKENWKAFYQLQRLRRQKKFDLIHCHTPMGGVLGRLVFGVFNSGKEKIIYTAHGFHFYKGAPIINWLLYYPAEWFLSWWTDALITINKEDYARAKRFKAKRVYYIPGVGVDVKRFCRFPEDSLKKRGELGIQKDDFILLSVGELIPRKNHQLVFQAMAKLKETDVYKKIQYLICGQGELKEELTTLAKKLGIWDHVQFLGYRSDISNLCNCSDVFLFMSLQEGLPVALMEAMACGMPIICSGIRGNLDLVVDGKNGRITDFNPEELADCLVELLSSQKMREKLGSAARKTIQGYSLEHIQKRMGILYHKELRESLGGGRM